MKNKKFNTEDPALSILVVYIAATILFLLIVIFGSSCRVIKSSTNKESKKTDSLVTDAGNVNKTNTNTTKEFDWFKTTLQYLQPKGGDTIINKNYYTSHNPAPSVVIMEGGKGKEETNTNNFDSSWDKRFRKLEETVIENSKAKDTKVLSAGQIIGLFFGAAVFCALLVVILSKIKLSWK